MKWFEFVMWFCIVAVLLMVTGCSFQTPILDNENDRAGFVITKPPMQISYRGDMTPEAEAFTLKVIRELKGVPFKEYTFNENHNVTLNSVDAKADNVNIQLHENSHVLSSK